MLRIRREIGPTSRAYVTPDTSTHTSQVEVGSTTSGASPMNATTEHEGAQHRSQVQHVNTLPAQAEDDDDAAVAEQEPQDVRDQNLGQDGLQRCDSRHIEVQVGKQKAHESRRKKAEQMKFRGVPRRTRPQPAAAMESPARCGG